MLEGAAIALVFLVIGYISGRKQRRKSLPKARIATCSCGHPRSMHADQGKGKCHETVPRDKYSSGYWMGTEHVPCTCQIYDGPEPLATLFAPEISE